MKRSIVSTQEIVRLYAMEHLTCEKIGNIYGLTRQAIAKRLRLAGISSRQGAWITGSCDFCHDPIRKRRCQWKKTRKHFCNEHCYFASLERPGYKPWRQGQRIARAVIGKHFKLEQGHIVHHKDGNSRNNGLDNLAVLAGQGDHLRLHRGSEARYLWDGAAIA